MSGKAQAPGGTHFQVPSQSGGSIQNVGGNLYVGEGRRRSASIGRAVAALGLALFFAGLFLLGAAGLDVYRQTGEVETIDAISHPGLRGPRGRPRPRGDRPQPLRQALREPLR